MTERSYAGYKIGSVLSPASGAVLRRPAVPRPWSHRQLLSDYTGLHQEHTWEKGTVSNRPVQMYLQRGSPLPDELE